MTLSVTYRSLLFVPGNRADRFDKAASSEADLVCIDLEDAVGPGDKETARANVIDYLRSAAPHVGVRINPPQSHIGEADLAALQGIELPFLMLPKVEGVEDLEAANHHGAPLFPLVETAKALLKADKIAAHPSVKYILFGGVDFSADLDCEISWEALLHARSHLATCGAAHGVEVFDVPYLDVRDPEGCEAEMRRLKAVGIHAKAAIHPAQIDPIHRALAPTDKEIAQARRVVEASQAAHGNVALLDGQLIEAPLLRRAQRILGRAK